MDCVIEQPRAVKSISIRPFWLVCYSDGQSIVWLLLRSYAVTTAEVEIVFPIPSLG